MNKRKVIKTVEKLQGAPYKYTTKEIKEMLIRNPIAVEKGIVAIFKKQTDNEQVDGETKDKNFKGFSAFHAKRGTYYATWIKQDKHLTNGHLEKGRTLILHYTKQLAKIANKEI